MPCLHGNSYVSLHAIEERSSVNAVVYFEEATA